MTSLNVDYEGVNLCIMPVSELVGRHLTQKLKPIYGLIVVFTLGSLATYAEPSLSSLEVLTQFKGF